MQKYLGELIRGELLEDLRCEQSQDCMLVCFIRQLKIELFHSICYIGKKIWFN